VCASTAIIPPSAPRIYDPPIAGYRITIRNGPRIERERHADLDAALVDLEHRVAELARTTNRAPQSFMGREFEPVQQVACRAELKGPRGLRAGIDVRGDGSAEAWRGRVRRTIVARQPGEDAYAALRRVVVGEG